MNVIELKVDVLKRHPIHERLNVVRTLDELESHGESILKYGRQCPIIFQYIDVDGKQVPHVVDGWSSVEMARHHKVETLPGIEIIDCSDEELPNLIVDVQTGFHRDPEEDYIRFEFFYELLSKGQGHRSDLEVELNIEDDDEE